MQIFDCMQKCAKKHKYFLGVLAVFQLQKYCHFVRLTTKFIFFCMIKFEKLICLLKQRAKKQHRIYPRRRFGADDQDDALSVRGAR